MFKSGEQSRYKQGSRSNGRKSEIVRDLSTGLATGDRAARLILCDRKKNFRQIKKPRVGSNRLTRALSQGFHATPDFVKPQHTMAQAKTEGPTALREKH